MKLWEEIKFNQVLLRRRQWQPTPVLLPGKSQGWRILVGCPLWGSHRVRHNWSDLATAAASFTEQGSDQYRPRRMEPGQIAFVIVMKSTQSCPTLCDPVDSRQPGSYVHGILQARILKWVAIPFSNAWKLKVKMKPLSHARLLVTPWTAVYQAPPMGFSRQEYWSGVPLSSPWSKAGIPNLSMKLKYSPKQLWKHFSPLEQNTFVSLKYNLMKISLFKIDKRSISDQKDSKD